MNDSEFSNDESLQQLERSLAAGLPAPLLAANHREVFVTSARRELTASRRDRRLGQLAAAVLAAGLGLNASLGILDDDASPGRPTIAAIRPVFIQTVEAVAEATDAETGKLFARQMATLGGWTLTADESAAIDAAAGETPEGKAG